LFFGLATRFGDFFSAVFLAADFFAAVFFAAVLRARFTVDRETGFFAFLFFLLDFARFFIAIVSPNPFR
jgi:hypothetical protein